MLSRINGIVIEYRRPDPAGAVQPDRVVVVRRDPLDRCDEQHHVEAHEAPDDHEHRGRHGGAGVPEPGEAGELVEPELDEDAVQQAGGRVEHLTPQDADDDRRDRVGEERDHPIEVGVPDPTRGPVRGAPHRDHRGQHEAEHDGHEGHHDRQQDVVPERGHEDVVVEQRPVVPQTDEVHVGREARPVGHGVVERLHERPHHEQQEDRQRQPEEHHEEADPVERQLAARLLATHDRGCVRGTDAESIT